MTDHIHNHPASAESKLGVGLALTFAILFVEVVGGIFSHSLALLSDAGHVLTDAVALSLSLYGVKQAKRPSSSGMTFGYHRVGVLIAIINALIIFAVAGVIVYEATIRFRQPVEVQSQLMLAVAGVGLGVNVFVALRLHGEQRENLNIRSAFWHALGDAMASMGVIVGAVIIMVTGWFWVDPVVSVLISVILCWAAWGILKEGFSVLLEATPMGVDMARMENILRQIPAVKEIHDIHVWSLSPEIRAMSCHILIDDIPTSQAASIRENIAQALARDFGITHTTLQLECAQCTEGGLCSISPPPPSKEEKPKGIGTRH